LSEISWITRQAFPEDLEPLRRLYKDVWGYNRPERFDAWRYILPTREMIPCALADADRQGFAGAYTLWPAELKIGDTITRGAQSMDTMTHPDFQGRGIFTKLATACYEQAERSGYQVLYGFPNPLSYSGFVKRLGWSHAGDMTHWIRLISAHGISRIPPPVRPFVNVAAKLLPKGSTKGFDITFGKPPAGELEQLLAAWERAAAPCRVHRSAGWLDWRYAESAENNYIWVCAYQDDALQACGVWGMQNASWGSVADQRAHLVELLGSDVRALRAVVAAVIDQAASQGAILLETVSNIDRLNKILRRAGFYAHRQAPFIVRTLGQWTPEVDVLSIGNWHIFGGDIDTF
jgi:GNAT superfamily N-acetyltransferase